MGWGTVLAAAGVGAALAGDKSKTKIKRLEPYPGSTAKMGELAGVAQPLAIQRLQRAGEPYTGKFTAPMSPYEEMGMGSLEDYLKSPYATADPLYEMGRGELEKTLGGEEYDPVGGTYYKAFREAVMRELREAKDRLAASTSSRDKYFGGGRIKTTGELEEQATGDLAMVLGQLFERERERKFTAGPMAMETALAETRMPAERSALAQELGRLPREIEQLGLDKEYMDYLRQMTELNIPLDVAMQLMMSQGDFTAQQTGGGGTEIAKAIAMAIAMRGK